MGQGAAAAAASGQLPPAPPRMLTCRTLRFAVMSAWHLARQWLVANMSPLNSLGTGAGAGAGVTSNSSSSAPPRGGSAGGAAPAPGAAGAGAADPSLYARSDLSWWALRFDLNTPLTLSPEVRPLCGSHELGCAARAVTGLHWAIL